MRLALRYEEGCEKYGDRNWEKGQPFSRVTDSMMRHAHQWLAGEAGEDHLAAVAWNAFALMTYQARIARGELPAELDDMPRPSVRVESTLGGNVLHVTGYPGNLTIPPVSPDEAGEAMDSLAYAIKGNPESTARMAESLVGRAEEIADRLGNDDVVDHPLPDWLHRHAWGWSMVVREETWRRHVVARAADRGETSIHKHDRLSHDIEVIDGSVEVLTAPAPEGPWSDVLVLAGQTHSIRAGVWHRIRFDGPASFREVYHKSLSRDSWDDITRHDAGRGPYANA